MVLFLTMNAADVEFQSMNSGNLISGFIAPLFQGLPLNIIGWVFSKVRAVLTVKSVPTILVI